MRVKPLLYFIMLFYGITSYGQSAVDYNENGNESFKIHDYSGAIAYYTKAIRADKNYSFAYYNRGNAKAKLRDYQGALLDFNNAIELEPNNSDNFYNRAYTEFKLGKNTSAIPDFTKAIELNYREQSKAYYFRGVCKTILKDYQSALMDFSVAIDLDQHNGEAYNERGLCKIVLGDNNGGCMDFSRAGELGYSEAYKSIKDLCN